MSSGVRAFSKGIFVVLLIAGWTLAAIGFWNVLRLTPLDGNGGGARVDQAPENEIAKAFEDWSADPSLAGAALSLVVLDETGEALFESPLASTALCPASALKTVTTATAFDRLGPEFRFETKLDVRGTLSAEGELDGDLVLVAGGDPTLSIEALERLVASVVESGLKSIRGAIRIDASVFPRQAVSDHWNWGDIGNAYGAGAFGVNLEHNRLSLRFAPGEREGDPASLLGSVPAIRALKWRNDVRTGPPNSGDRVMAYSVPYGDTIQLSGTVPLDEPFFQVSAAIPDPAVLAEEILRKTLLGAGVRIMESAAGREAEITRTLAVHYSRPLPEIVDHLHLVSDNLEAQCFYLMLERREGRGTTEVIRDYWKERGVELSGFRMLDGSGLARANMIRAVDLVKINHLARHGSHGDRFLQSLAASRDGVVRSKRGAMSGVRTEVGFFKTPAGKERAFVLMANGVAGEVDFWKRRDALMVELTRMR